MDAHDIKVDVLAERSHMSRGVIQDLRSGRMRKGQGRRNPAVNTLAAVADGLGLRFSYVASKGGLTDEGDRWAAFTAAERQFIAGRLGADPGDLDATIQKEVV